MGLLATLDRFVHVTRLDVMTPYADRRPRNLRWLPLIVLVAMAAGYVLQVGAMRGAGWSWQTGFAGSVLFVLALVAANLARLFGPRAAADRNGPLDERELTLNARAGSLSGTILTLLAMFACFYAAFAVTFGTWLPATAIEWVYLGFAVQAGALILPVLIASWLQPALDEEE